MKSISGGPCVAEISPPSVHTYTPEIKGLGTPAAPVGSGSSAAHYLTCHCSLLCRQLRGCLCPRIGEPSPSCPPDPGGLATGDASGGRKRRRGIEGKRTELPTMRSHREDRLPGRESPALEQNRAQRRKRKWSRENGNNSVENVLNSRRKMALGGFKSFHHVPPSPTLSIQKPSTWIPISHHVTPTS